MGEIMHCAVEACKHAALFGFNHLSKLGEIGREKLGARARQIGGRGVRDTAKNRPYSAVVAFTGAVSSGLSAFAVDRTVKLTLTLRGEYNRLIAGRSTCESSDARFQPNVGSNYISKIERVPRHRSRQSDRT